MIIIGIDPDSDKHGVAVYENGKLTNIYCMSTIELYRHIIGLSHWLTNPETIEVHIEDVCGNRCSSFSWRKNDSVRVKAKKSESVGRCKQAQIEVERVCEYLGVPVVKHKVSSMWKDAGAGKKQFEMVTGWDGRSNPDSRSGAYFGWLGVTGKRK